MKVLQLVKTSSGAPWALQQMIELLTAGYEVHAALPAGGTHIQEYLDAGIRLHYIQYNLKRPFTTIKRLRKIVDEVQPDIIHSHFFNTTIIMRIGLRRYKIPRFFQLPGPSHLYYRLLKWMEIAVAQKDRDYWIGACKFSQQTYLDYGIDKSHVFLSYYQGEPVKEPEFKDERKLRMELGLPDSAIMIGMISYMYPPKFYLGQKHGIKGHEDFIKAIAIASKENPNIYGICIGGAWNGAVGYEKSIHDMAHRLTNNIIFAGSRSRTEVQKYYPEFFCAVQPSHQENLGGAGQAYRYGCPIIATNTGGLPDLVIDGVTGYLVPVKAPKELAKAIMKSVNDPVKTHEMMLEGRKHYIQLKERNRGSLVKIYRQVVGC